MDYIHKLPFIFSCILAITIGIACFANKENNQTIYIKMAVSLIMSYLLGIYIRSILNRTIVEVRERIKMKEEEKKIQEILERQQNKANNDDSKGIAGTKIDLKADDYGDDFMPLKVSEAIKSTILKDMEKI